MPLGLAIGKSDWHDEFNAVWRLHRGIHLAWQLKAVDFLVFDLDGRLLAGLPLAAGVAFIRKDFPTRLKLPPTPRPGRNGVGGIC